MKAILTVLVAIGFLHSVPKQTDQPYSSHDAANYQQGAITFTALFYNPVAEEETDDANSKADEPNWCKRLISPLITNWPLIVVAVVGVWVANRTLRAIKRQADVMQRQLEVSERPWVSVERIPLALRFEGGGVQLMCNFKLENTGGSVAWNVSIWTELVTNGSDWRLALQRLCNIPKDPVNAASDYGYVLFPGKDVTIRDHPAVLGQEATQQAIQMGPFKDMHKIGLTFVGCVDYRSHVTEQHHQTTFVDLVGYAEQPAGRIMGAFEPAKQIYMPVVLTPTEHGASAS